MEGRFLSAKRPFDMPDTISANANGSSKRRPKPPPPPIVVSASDAAFRLLCPTSKIGGVIGKSGAVVNLLRQETGTKIRVEDPVPDCDERAVLIVGPNSSTKRIAINPGEEREVSPAQEALIRVFDRVLEVDAETDGGAAPGIVSCRLLVASGQVGCVMGKGGKVIERIRKGSGAKIKVLPGEQLPLCAEPTDEVIQIMGDAIAVKKALLAVSKCLQENPSLDKAQIVVSKPVGSGLHGSITDTRGSFPDTRGSFPDPHGEHFSHRNSFLSPTRRSSLDYVARGHTLPTAVQKISTLDQKNIQEEVAFRLLCPNDKVGGVIGKGGTIINALENETGASISVGSTMPGSEERLITITAMENPESRYSAAQNAVDRVFTRSVEAGYEKGLDSGSGKGASVAARLLVATNQIGCLMGKGGTIIAEMRKATGASIRILGGDQVPICASENDEVVQITGEFENVQDALFHVTSRLRDNILPAKTIDGAGAGIYHSTIPESASYGRIREPTSPVSYSSLGRLSHMHDRPSALAHSMDHLGLSHSIDRPPSPRIRSSQSVGSGNSRSSITDIGARGLPPLRGCVELGSGSKSAIVTNTTVDIIVPEHVMGAVYGENGCNLSRIRQISGAKVVVHDPRPGVRDGMVIISGTPDQTQAAQSLLQAFILSAPSPDSHSRLL